MLLTGTVLTLDAVPARSHLTAGAAAGATTLTVEDVTVFDPDGGTLVLDGATVTYTASDVDAGTVTLAAGLAGAVEAGWPVTVPDAVTYWAQVSPDDPDAEPVLAMVSADMVPMVPAGSSVEVESVGGQRRIRAVIGQEPTFDGSVIDPATMGWVTDADAANADAIQAAVDDFASQLADRPPKIESTSDPGSTANVVGTIWEKYDTLTPPGGVSRKLLAAWRGLGGTSWVPVSLDVTYIPQIDVNTGTIGTLGVERLLVGDMTNLVRDPRFAGRGSWVVTSGAPVVGVTVVAGPQGGTDTALRSTAVAGVADQVTDSGARVTPGQELHVAVWLRYQTTAPTAGIAYAGIQFKDAAGATISTVYPVQRNANTLTTAWVEHTGTTVVPVGAVTANLIARTSSTVAPNGAKIDFADFRVRRRMGGELLVDGTITARHITADMVSALLLSGRVLQTNTDPARGIKISDAGLVGYDTAGVARTVIDPTTGRISATGSFATATGFDDIEIVPGNATTPAVFRFLSDGAYYDTAAPASFSCYDSVATVDGATWDTVNVRLQGAKMVGSGTTPRIDIGTRKRRTDGAVTADVAYHAGAQGSGVEGAHYFYIDGAIKAWVSGVQLHSVSEIHTESGFIDTNYYGGGTTGASVNNNGRFIRTGSSERYKKYVRPLTLTEAQAALALEPVTFQWRAAMDMGDRRQPGFIAEQAHDAGAGLWVTYQDDDPDGGLPDGFRYPELTAAHNLLIADLVARVEALEGAA